ncbi:signal peptidase I [Nocardioides salsibiostraticola]
MSRLREGLLWLGAIAGLVSLTAAVAVTFFGFSFLIFRSGSMGPGIPTGSLALARTVPAVDIGVGDVVSVVAANRERITHRVVSATLRGDGAALILQGDANGAADDEMYLVDQVEREIASVPYAGYVVTVLLSPAGLLGVACLSAMMLMFSFGPGSQSPGRPSRARPSRTGGGHRAERSGHPRHAVAAAVAVLATVAGIVLAGLGVNATSAFYSDEGTLRTQDDAFTSAEISVPATPTTQRQGTSVKLSWSPATPVGAAKATSYQVLRFVTSTGGTGTVACSAVAPTLTCTDTSPLSGASYYALRARIGTNWVNESPRMLYTVDLTGPSLVILGPASGSYDKRDDVQDTVKDACKPLVEGTSNDKEFAKDVPACGTVSDPSGVKSVEYQLQRYQLSLLGIPLLVQCYDGITESWSTNCAYRSALLNEDKSAWKLPSKFDDAHTKDAAYTYILSVRATDESDNVSAPVTITYSTRRRG